MAKKNTHAYEIVKIARKAGRPTALQFIEYLSPDFIELHGDRLFRDDAAVVGGVGMLDERPVTFIGIQKGRSVEENIIRNFGQVHPEGYRKAMRLMKQAEKFKRPVVTLVNTAGAFCGVGAEERGQGEAIARNLYEMSSLKTPIISVIIGEGGSGGALALAVADRVWIMENGFYSILSPEGFSSILWKDGTRGAEAAEVMKLTSADLLEFGVADAIIPEAEGGMDRDFLFTVEKLKDMLVKELKSLAKKDTDKLLDERYKRFRKYGDFI